MKRFKINLTQHMNEINGVATVILGLAMFIILGLAAYDLRPVTVEKPVKINLPQSHQAFMEEYNTVQSKVLLPFSNEVEYFDTSYRIERLEALSRLLLNGKVDLGESKGAINANSNNSVLLNDLWTSNTNRLDNALSEGIVDLKKFDAERTNFEQRIKSDGLNPETHFNPSWNFIWYFIFWQFLLGCVCLLNNVVFCFENEMKARWELLKPTIYFASFLAELKWLGLINYPVKVTKQEQWNSLKLYLSYGFGFLFTVTGVSFQALAQSTSPIPKQRIEATAEDSSENDAKATSNKSVEVNLTFTVKSKELANNGAIFSEKPAIATSATISRGDWYGNLTYNHPFTTNTTDGSRFSSATIGYGRKAGRFSLDGNVSYIAAEPYRTSQNDALNFNTSISTIIFDNKKVEVEPFIANDVFIPIRSEDIKGGIWFQPGVNINIKPATRVTVNVSPRLVFDSGVFGFNPGIIKVVDAKTTFNLSDQIKLGVTHKLTMQKHRDFGRKPIDQAFGFIFNYHF